MKKLDSKMQAVNNKRFHILLTNMLMTILLVTNQFSNAQVIYIDINPDTTISEIGGYYDLDLNNDGVFDYKISRTGFGDYNSVGILGLQDSCYISYYSLDGCTYATEYTINEIIGYDESWTNENMGINIANFGGITTCMHYGSFSGQIDKSLGLKLVKNGVTYFGWARIDVAYDATWFTMKDFASNNNPIVAGLGLVNVILIADPDVYYCEDEEGVTLSVENSVNGTQYILQKLEGTWTNKATTMGNGGIQPFTGLWEEGDYRLSSYPGNILTVILIEITVFDVTISNDGEYCSNDPIDIFITLSGSQFGVEYSLVGSLSGELETLSGIGAPLFFGPYFYQEEFWIEAYSNEGACLKVMNGSVLIIENQSPVAGFNYNIFGPPAGCSEVIFINTSTPGDAPIVLYEWDFNSDGIIDSNLESPSYNFPAYGNLVEDFNVSLTAIDANGCSETYSEVVTISQRPNASIIDLGIPPSWALCNFDPTLTIANNSSTIASNVYYYIDWGDGTPAFEYSGSDFGNTSHIYPGDGYYGLHLTVQGDNGCISDTVYNVFVGSTPAVGITWDAGSLKGCAPHCITFYLDDSAGDNPLGTLYEFNWGDGNTMTILQEDLPVPNPDGEYEFEYCYDVPSCGEPDNAFTMSLFVVNPCDNVVFTIGGIQISEPPVAVLEPNVLTDSIYVCQGIPYNFNATPGGGCFVFNANFFTEETTYYWDFYNDGSIEYEGENLNSVSYTFPDEGVYEVSLSAVVAPTAADNCGADEMIRIVCVQAPPEASFIFPANSECAEYTLIPTNTSTFTDCGTPEFYWEILPNDGGWHFATGSSESSFEPTIEFVESGDYTIRLRARTYSSESQLCGEDWTDYSNITIVDVPEVTLIDPLPTLDFCNTVTYDFIDSLEYNSNLSTIISYEWTVNPPVLPFNDNEAFPTIIFDGPAPQIYTVSVRAENECGWSDPLIFNISIGSDIENNLIWYNGQLEICEGENLIEYIFGTTEIIPHPLPPNLPLSGGNGVYNYQWYINIDDGNGFLEVPGETGPDLVNLNSLPGGTIKFLREVLSGGCYSESNELVFNVSPEITNNLIINSYPQHICEGDEPAPLIGGDPQGGDGVNYTFLWQQSEGCNNTWTDASGINNERDYTPLSITVTTCYRRIVISGICESETDPIDIYVYGDIVNNSISLDDPNNLEICEGESPGLMTGSIPSQLGNINPNPFSYLWEQTTDPVAGPWVAADGTNDLQFYTPPALLVTTYYRRIAIANPPAPAGCNQDTSDYIEIIVNPNPVADAGNNVSIVPSSPFNLDGQASGGSGNYSYLWDDNDPANNLFTIPEPVTIPNPTTIPLSPPPSCYTFTLTVTDDNTGCTDVDDIDICFSGNVLSVTCESVYPDPVTMDQSVCIDDPNPFELTVAAMGGSGTYTYTWTTPTGFDSGETIFYTHDGTCGTKHFICEVDDGITTAICELDIEVECPSIITSPLEVNLCSGDFLNYTPTGVLGIVDITEFEWTVIGDPNGCITGFSNGGGTNPIINDQLFNDGPLCNTVDSVFYEITPIGPDPLNCPGVPSTLMVNVAPVPLIELASYSQIVISDGPSSVVVPLASNVAGVTYYWEVVSESCGPGVVTFPINIGTTAILPAQTFSISPTGPDNCVITFEITPFFEIAPGQICEGESAFYEYYIQKEPEIFNIICPGPICEGSSTNIDLDGSQSGIQYQIFLDGIPITGQPILNGNGLPLTWVGIAEPGTYTVVGTNPANGLSVLMNGSCQVVVNQLPVVYAGSDAVICIANTYMIVDATVDFTSIFEWTIISGFGAIDSPNIINPNYTPDPSDAGTTVQLTLCANGMGGCFGEVICDTINIFVEPFPEVYAGAGFLICENSTYQMQPFIDYYSSVLWTPEEYFDDPANPFATFLAPSVSSEIIIPLTLTVYGEGSCSFESVVDIIDVTIKPLPEVFAGSDGTTCSNEPYYVDDASTNNTALINWEILYGSGSLDISTILNPTYYPALGDEGTQVVIVFEGIGIGECSSAYDSDTLYIFVEYVPIAYFTFENTCVNQPVQFTDLSEPGVGNIVSWNWSFGDGAYSSLQNPQYIYAEPGIYMVDLIVTNSSGCSDTITQEITINELPDVSLEPFEPVCLTWPAFEFFGGLPEGGIYTGNGVVDNWFYPETAGLGTHIITYTYEDINGCENFDQEAIYVDPCTGVPEQSMDNKVLIYPNPNIGSFNIKLTLLEPEQINIQIFNVLNELVFSKNNISVDKEITEDINLLNQPDGLYYVLISGQNTHTMKKIILQ